MKTIVYIDGFNLYYAIRNRNCKWLNPMALAKRVLSPKFTIQAIKYYTARVSGIVDPGQPRRQQIYFSALKTIPEIQIILGNFLAKTVYRPLANIPIANREIIYGPQVSVLPAGNHQVMKDLSRADSKQEIMTVGSYPLKNASKINVRLVPMQNGVRVQVHWMEEKGSDVNLASHLINDAWSGRYDAAAVLSNDTDLVEPIRVVTKELGKPVFILSAATRGTAPALKAVATNVLHISSAHLRSSVFPNVIPGTSITKPSTW